jgi:hypothetical protein
MCANQIDPRHAVAGGNVDPLWHVPAAEFEVLRLVSTRGGRAIDPLQRAQVSDWGAGVDRNLSEIRWV